MFSTMMRLLLIAGSLATIVFMMLRIRSSKVLIKDSIFWIFFSVLLLVLSIVPEAAAWAARLLGIEAPINFVYLLMIFLLVIRLFSSTVKVSQLDAKVQALTQRLALYENAHGETAPGQDDSAGPGEK